MTVRMLTAVSISFFPLAAAATDHGHVVSITNSPLHLASPGIVEMTGEYAVNRSLGVALIAGYGQPTLETEDESTGDVTRHDVTVYEAGAQARYYLFGSFDHGMQVGGEVLYLSITGFEEDGVRGSASGFGIGPFIGYKKTARFGLTFDAQLGFQYFAAQAEASDNDGNSAEGDSSSTGVLLNLNLGWAF